MRRALTVIVVAVALLLVAGSERARAQSCSGSTWCGEYKDRICDCANAKLTRMDCVPSAGACGEYNCDGDPGSCWCSGTCNWTGGGGIVGSGYLGA